MKTAILFLFSILCLAAKSQVTGDTLIGKQYGRDSIMKPLMQTMLKYDSNAIAQYTSSGKVAQKMRRFDAKYQVTGDGATLDYSAAGFTTILSYQVFSESPADNIIVRSKATSVVSMVLSVLKLLPTTVTLTGQSISPTTPATSLTNSYVYLSVVGY